MSEEKIWIKEFADKYTYNLETQVIPFVKNFEKERKIRLIFAVLLVTIIAILTITSITFLIFLTLNSGTDFSEYRYLKPLFKYGGKKFIIIGVFVCVYLWKKIQQDFEYKIKNEVMPVLISTFNGFQWIDVADDEFYQDVLDSDIFLYIPKKKITHAYLDLFQGYFQDVKLEFSQAIYNTKNYNFNGGMIRIKMNKNFTGKTVLRPKGVSCKDLIDAGYEKITLEDVEFNKKFSIYSTDQVEARYLLTPAFMDRLKNILIQFTKSDKIYCSFYDDHIYIAPESKHDMFSLFGLTRPANNIKEFNILFAQIVSVMALVEYLKLNIRTGL